jgi:hypothetical protein
MEQQSAFLNERADRRFLLYATSNGSTGQREPGKVLLRIVPRRPLSQAERNALLAAPL